MAVKVGGAGEAIQSHEMGFILGPERVSAHGLNRMDFAI